MAERENKEFVFIGNTTYEGINKELETGIFRGALRVGPALDHAGGYMHDLGLIGRYVLCNTTTSPGENMIRKDREGRKITLEMALSGFTIAQMDDALARKRQEMRK